MSRSETKANRLLKIEALLLEHPEGLTQAEIARRLGVHRSTVGRYLPDLTEHTAVYDEGGRLFIDRAAYLVNVRLSLHEAMAVHLAARLLATRMDRHNPHAAAALRKLGLALRRLAPRISEHLARSADSMDDSGRRQDPVYLGVLEQLTLAWAEERKVRVWHRHEETGRVYEYVFAPYYLEPYAVGQTTHVIGFREPPGKLRTFKVERIERVELLRESYTIPEDFDPGALLANAWGIWYTEREPVEVVLRFHPRVVHRVRESRWHPSEAIEEQPDGSLLWRAQVAETQEMLPWIRGWGADVEVLEPIEVRKQMGGEAVRLARVYEIADIQDQFIAHTRNNQGEYHELVTHLQSVANLAADFAAPMHASELARFVGLWHDLGKFHPDFQQYLLDAEAGQHRKGPDHKAAGVRVAREHGLDPIMLLLQGHHGGLKNRTDLHRWYEQCKNGTEKALSIAREVLDFKASEQPPFPAFARRSPRSAEFFLRMLFSALVDADFLDTEAHFNPERGAYRDIDIDMKTLWQRFVDDQQKRFADISRTSVNRSRQEIYEACQEAASQPPGLFRLTVPTGGGKTRSGMAFALRHAMEHGQRCIIVAVPYITITQQTAAVCRRIFNRGEDDPPIVLEHHSGVAEQRHETEKYDPRSIWQRLAAENWDAPIIVTTTVQLFESLFANSTSRCRKLHRLANSVIILDEAQSLPAHLLDPMLDALRELCANYGSTVVLSTATQPAFNFIEPFREIDAREIVPNPDSHFQSLKRVHYEWRVEEPVSWEEVASLMRTEAQALAICNTKKDTLDLMDALDDPEALHLSTLLCGAHRLAVIEEITRRLKTGNPCRLVATQVVEAGVDIDFPLVLRALGPLDSIIQAAGRANREGKLDQGRFIVFKPVDGGLPPGAYQRAAETTVTLLNSGPLDMHDPATMQRYFRKLYQLEDTDREEIQKQRSNLDYLEVARRFRLIKDDTISVIVTSYGSEEQRQQVRAVLERLRAGAPPTRHLLRQLQPYTVSLFKHQASKYLNEGLLLPQSPEGLPPGIWEWVGKYDQVCGLSGENIFADALIV